MAAHPRPTVAPELVALFEDLAETLPGVARKLVFGRPTCVLGGYMFFGVHPTGLFVRLPPETAEQLLAAGGEPFEPMPGRTMNGFAVLPESMADPEPWVRLSYEYAAGLPPKKAGSAAVAKRRSGAGPTGSRASAAT